MNMQNQFGLRVKELRHQLGISQEALAFKAGIDRTYMTGVENGKRNVSAKNMEKIIKALELPIPDFFNSKLFV